MSRLNLFNTRPKLVRIPVDLYLERIGLEKESPSLGYLKKLQKSHLYEIPFENLDIVFRKRTEFDIHKFFEKIVTKKRGGIPTELNLLFYHLLDGLGFDSFLLSASLKENDTWGSDFYIPLVITRIDGINYLSDVGSLSLFIEPLKLVANTIQLDYNRYFRFVTDPDENFILQKSADCISFPGIYKFEILPKEVIQFLEKYRYFYESSDSPFLQSKMIFRNTHEGSIKLSDTSIQIIQRGVEKTHPILHEDDFASKLQEHFGLNYDQLFRERFDE